MSKKYIDADELRDKWIWGNTDRTAECMYIEVSDLDAMPAADVRENVRGEWEEMPEEDPYYYKCSVCGARSDMDCYHYCPICGADMRRENGSKVS